METLSEVERYLYCRIAVIEIRPGETKEVAWSRHLANHPEDSNADIKIFNLDRTACGTLKSTGITNFIVTK